MDYPGAMPNIFSGGDLDRGFLERAASDWLLRAREAPDTRYVIATTGGLLLLQDAEAGGLALLTGDHPLVRDAQEEAQALLGILGTSRRILVEIAAEAAAASGLNFSELRPAVPLLTASEAALAAYARAMALWRARQRFCGVCGYPTAPLRAGHLLKCTNPDCRSEFFPRIDPAIIVLVSDGDHALLGRQPVWPPGRFSTIAGFVEPGESLEDAVSREVLEETGVRVLSLSYQSSQPWPFPSQLMLGFHARADRHAPAAPDVDGELEEYRWFSRAQILSGAVRLPPPESISYRLIRGWVDEGASTVPSS